MDSQSKLGSAGVGSLLFFLHPIKEKGIDASDSIEMVEFNGY